MRPNSDYRDDVFIDQDIERLLSGQTPTSSQLAQVVPFVKAVRSYRNEATQTIDIEQLSAKAAALVISKRTRLDGDEARLKITHPLPRHILPIRRIAVGTAVFALFASLSGTAVAANMSNPGDALYGLDRAMERVGIANGHVQERTSEADALLAEGNSALAFSFLGEYLEELTSQGNEESAEKIIRHIELAASKTNPKAQETQEKVAELKAFIELNKYSGVGLDGKEFGQGISEIARGKANLKKSNSNKPYSEEPATGRGSTGPKEDKGHAPAHAGPKDK